MFLITDSFLDLSLTHKLSVLIIYIFSVLVFMSLVLPFYIFLYILLRSPMYNCSVAE